MKKFEGMVCRVQMDCDNTIAAYTYNHHSPEDYWVGYLPVGVYIVLFFVDHPRVYGWKRICLLNPQKRGRFRGAQFLYIEICERQVRNLLI